MLIPSLFTTYIGVPNDGSSLIRRRKKVARRVKLTKPIAKKFKIKLDMLADKLVGEGAYKSVGPISPKKFDITDLIKDDKFKPEDDSFCACAMGYAIYDPYFNGLKRFNKRSLVRLKTEMQTTEFWFGKHSQADCLLFDIFWSDGYGKQRSPRDVALRIRHYTNIR